MGGGDGAGGNGLAVLPEGWSVLRLPRVPPLIPFPTLASATTGERISKADSNKAKTGRDIGSSPKKRNDLDKPTMTIVATEGSESDHGH